MNRSLMALLCLVAAGCSRTDPELEARLARQEEALQALETKVAGLQKTDAEVLGEPKPSDVQRYARQVGLAQKDLQRSIRIQQEQIDELRTLVDKREEAAPAAAEPAPVAPDEAARVQSRTSALEKGFYTPVSVYTPPNPALADFIEPPVDPKADLFPVAITDARSEKIVTGTHETTQIVQSGETYEDEFGNIVPRFKEQDVALQEYDYQIRFAARNLTRTPKDITAGAGRDSTVITLQPGESQTNLTIAAAFGADLTVRSRGEVRRFEVNYDE